LSPLLRESQAAARSRAGVAWWAAAWLTPQPKRRERRPGEAHLDHCFDELPPLVRGLLDPRCYPVPADTVTLRQTHVSSIFLVGERAYKVKKPVDLGFLDFSTLEQRAHFCEREVVLNRRLAPAMSLGVVPIVRAGAGYRVGGEGPAIEWTVAMRRLPEDRLLTARLAADQVTPDDKAHIARHLAGLERRLVHFSEPLAELVVQPHPAPRQVEAALRVQLGSLGPHVVSHQQGETLDRAVRLAVADVERELERHLGKPRGEDTFGVPSRRRPPSEE
jgi:aminoglycoside phosphotransferase family enzyme